MGSGSGLTKWAPTQRPSLPPQIWRGKRGISVRGCVPDAPSPRRVPRPRWPVCGSFSWAHTFDQLPEQPRCQHEANFSLIPARKEKKGSLLSTVHNEARLCFTEGPGGFPSAGPAGTRRHGLRGRPTAFSLLRGENLSPLYSPSPGFPSGHPESGRGT